MMVTFTIAPLSDMNPVLNVENREETGKETIFPGTPMVMPIAMCAGTGKELKEVLNKWNGKKKDNLKQYPCTHSWPWRSGE